MGPSNHADPMCTDPYGVHAAWRAVEGEVTSLRSALEKINEPPTDDDPIQILQDHWDTAATALKGK